MSMTIFYLITKTVAINIKIFCMKVLYLETLGFLFLATTTHNHALLFYEHEI